MGVACCRQQAPHVPAEAEDECTRIMDGPSLTTPILDATPEADLEESETLEDELPSLPAGGMFTVLMFGMTGAGKSALGNLMAGCEAFASGDDTASITNLDSLMRYEAADDSLVILDTIGLGDTEIDQDKVVASIRDVALSAMNGVDAMCFVMRNARITDDAIARLIYVTEYLWGSECLLNLYVIVTFASKYLASREEANQWIERQVELNWRFKHIYDLVGRNPYRFLFVDNPGNDSGEPQVEERQIASKRALMQAFVQHPRDVIPPFTHSVMEKARQLVEEQKKEADKATEKFAQLKKKKRKSKSARTSRRMDTTDSVQIKAAFEEKKKAQMSLNQALLKVRSDADFQREVAMEAELATLRFGQDYDATDSEEVKAVNGAPAKTPVQACKRMFFSLVSKISRKSGRKESKELKKEKPKVQKPKAEDLQRTLEVAIYQLKSSVKGSPQLVFKQLDPRQTGNITPLEFSNFVQKRVQGISKAQVGGLWRLADRNCDGKLDLQEFTDLLSFRSVYST